jgi:transcription termination factor NusB
MARLGEARLGGARLGLAREPMAHITTPNPKETPMDLKEVREKIAEIDAKIKAAATPYRQLRAKWTAVERALLAEAAIEAMTKTRKDQDDESE